MGIYVEGLQTRITCQRCGIDYYVHNASYAQALLRQSKTKDICRDCRYALREGFRV